MNKVKLKFLIIFILPTFLFIFSLILFLLIFTNKNNIEESSFNDLSSSALCCTGGSCTCNNNESFSFGEDPNTPQGSCAARLNEACSNFCKGKKGVKSSSGSTPCSTNNNGQNSQNINQNTNTTTNVNNNVNTNNTQNSPCSKYNNGNGCCVRCKNGESFKDICPGNGNFLNCFQWAEEACRNRNGIENTNCSNTTTNQGQQRQQNSQSEPEQNIQNTANTPEKNTQTETSKLSSCNESCIRKGYGIGKCKNNNQEQIQYYCSSTTLPYCYWNGTENNDGQCENNKICICYRQMQCGTTIDKCNTMCNNSGCNNTNNNNSILLQEELKNMDSYINNCSCYDCNKDGKVDIIDFACFAKIFNTTCLECGCMDCNSDGKINTVDFSCFSKVFGLNCR